MLSRHILGSIFEKNKKLIIGLSFSEKSYCEYNHRTILKNQKFSETTWKKYKDEK